MKILISNVIAIKEPSKEILEYFKKKLTYTNPQYSRMKNMGYSTYKVPRDIKLYTLFENTLYIPVGCFDDVWRLHPVTSDYTDYCVDKPINIESDIKLRDYQQPCIDAVRDYCNVILSMGCGMGKTLSCLAAVGEIKQKTLWLAGTIDLVKQAESSCRKFMKCKTSFISEGKMNIEGDIVFATVQSVYKFIQNGELSQNEFGCVVLDECQHLSANPNSLELFRTVFEYFAAKYRVGLSATVWRTDGLEKAIIDIIGPIKYNIIQKGQTYSCIYNDKCLMKFPIDKFQVPCHVKAIETGYTIDNKDVFMKNGGTINFAALISDIGNNTKRNQLILKDLKNISGSTIVLSDRITQLKYLLDNLDSAVLITGDTPKKIREQNLQDVRDGKKKYLLASYSLAREGLDAPILSNLVLATPIKAFSSVVQSIGRIQRLYEGKTIAYVYDYVDDVGMLYGFYSKRRAIYRKNGWIIDNMYLGNK